jgi:copper(I)-binding protein
MGGMDMGMNGPVSAAYMLIENRGGAADRLLRASTDAAAVVEIHETQIDDQGVGRMRPLVEGLEIPANGSVRLEPGGYHIMLMDLRRDLVAGEIVRLTLTFESGKEITVEAEIRQP